MAPSKASIYNVTNMSAFKSGAILNNPAGDIVTQVGQGEIVLNSSKFEFSGSEAV
jgi:hypothetical protein